MQPALQHPPGRTSGLRPKQGPRPHRPPELFRVHFCGATGRLFGHQVTPWNAWIRCREPERPATSPCFKCPLYLAGESAQPDGRYLFRLRTATEQELAKTIVAGPGASRANRLQAGRWVRQPSLGEQVE